MRATRSFTALCSNTLAFQKGSLNSSNTRFFSSTNNANMAPTPIVVCGKSPQIAQLVRKHLLPEYDVVHICMSVNAGVSEIPLLLSGKVPQNVDDNLGSKNYSQIPIAVAAGGGFNDEMVMTMKKACDETAGAEKVPWLKLDKGPLRPGQTVATEAPKPEQFDEFSKATAERVKTCLAKEEVKGDGIWLY